MKCNHDCDNCIYSDCIDDEVTVADFQRVREDEKRLARDQELQKDGLDCRRRWELQNYERARENKRRWYEKNKERLKEKNRRYYKENKEKIKEKQREYRVKNAEFVRAIDRENHRKYRKRAAEKAGA